MLTEQEGQASQFQYLTCLLAVAIHLLASSEHSKSTSAPAAVSKRSYSNRFARKQGISNSRLRSEIPAACMRERCL